MDFPTSHDFIPIPDDGLAVTTAEPWVRNKVQLIKQHIISFVNSFSSQVDELVFVDLFSRNGFFCLGARREIFPGVAAMVLQDNMPFTKYVLCEGEPDQFNALKIRINKYFKNKNIVLLQGRPAQLVDKLKMYIPENRRNHKVAVICVADSFSLEPGLESIHQLGLHGFNFIMPLTFHLGPRLDYKHFLGHDREKVKTFLGYLSDAEKDWRPSSNEMFYKQLTHLWKSRLEGMGFNVATAAQRLDSGLMEIPTYQFFFMSSRYSARAIQDNALTGSNVQFSLFNQN